MKISKQLNNNIVIASDDQGREVVLMGKGIGFGCKPGSEPNMALVEKQFFGFSSGAHTQQLAELLDRIPLEHLSLGMEIVEHIQQKIQKPLNETLVLMVSDHISFAIERHKKGLDLTNALLWEIKKFYPDEYQLGLNALDIIQREAGIRLREDEAGFLAMHIVNAQYGSEDTLAQDLIQVIQDVVNLVRYTYGIDLDENSLDYIRFVTHLKFFLARIFTKQAYQGGEDLYSIVSAMYPKAAAASGKSPAICVSGLTIPWDWRRRATSSSTSNDSPAPERLKEAPRRRVGDGPFHNTASRQNRRRKTLWQRWITSKHPKKSSRPSAARRTSPVPATA